MNTQRFYPTLFLRHLAKKILAFAIIVSIMAIANPIPVSYANGKTTTFRSKAKVKKLRKTKVTSQSVRLKWRKAKGATGYLVYRSTSRKGPFHKVALTRKNQLTNKKLSPGKTYFYKVRAFQAVKKKKRLGRFSAILKVQTKKIPKNTTSTSGSSSTTSVTITSSTPDATPAASDLAASFLPIPASSTTPDTTPTATETPTHTPGINPLPTDITSSPTETPAVSVPPANTSAPTHVATTAPSPMITSAPVLPTATPAAITEKYDQPLNYQEITDTICNPDQGFYRPIYVRVTEDGVTYNKNIVNDSTQLYHLRIDISAFSQANNETADQKLTETALSGIDELLSFLYEQNKSAIARFVYDPGLSGASNKEPALDMILQHITQISAVLDKYHDTLTAIEVGLIGPWGEMHTSTMANREVINALIDSYLNLTTEIPILVRTPQMMYHYLGITINDIDTYRIENTAKAYRLGLYNDGYLGSSTDLGTYSNREKEVPWLALQTAHLPYGGEVVIPDSTLHDIENCLDEMFSLHLSYLNIEWNYAVVDKWKDSYYTETAGTDSLYYGKTAFQYIENHMGYRFVLENATLEYDADVSWFAIDLSLKNVGFGNLNRSMNMTLLLQDETGEVTAINAGHFDGQENITFQTDWNLQEGNYNVYLKLDKGNGKYALRFANDLWNEELQANQIGSFTKVNS